MLSVSLGPLRRARASSCRAADEAPGGCASRPIEIDKGGIALPACVPIDVDAFCAHSDNSDNSDDDGDAADEDDDGSRGSDDDVEYGENDNIGNDDGDDGGGGDRAAAGSKRQRQSPTKPWGTEQFPEKNVLDMKNLQAALSWNCPCPDRQNCLARLNIVQLYEHRAAFQHAAKAQGGLRATVCARVSRILRRR